MSRIGSGQMIEYSLLCFFKRSTEQQFQIGSGQMIRCDSNLSFYWPTMVQPMIARPSVKPTEPTQSTPKQKQAQKNRAWLFWQISSVLAEVTSNPLSDWVWISLSLSRTVCAGAGLASLIRALVFSSSVSPWVRRFFHWLIWYRIFICSLRMAVVCEVC